MDISVFEFKLFIYIDKALSSLPLHDGGDVQPRGFQRPVVQLTDGGVLSGPGLPQVGRRGQLLLGLKVEYLLVVAHLLRKGLPVIPICNQSLKGKFSSGTKF